MNGSSGRSKTNRTMRDDSLNTNRQWRKGYGNTLNVLITEMEQEYIYIYIYIYIMNSNNVTRSKRCVLITKRWSKFVDKPDNHNFVNIGSLSEERI